MTYKPSAKKELSEWLNDYTWLHADDIDWTFLTLANLRKLKRRLEE